MILTSFGSSSKKSKRPKPELQSLRIGHLPKPAECHEVETAGTPCTKPALIQPRSLAGRDVVFYPPTDESIRMCRFDKMVVVGVIEEFGSNRN